MAGTPPRMVSYSSSLNPDLSRIGSLEIRVTYKVSTAGQTIVVGEDYTAQPTLFFPVRDLASVRNASLFLSTVVAGYLGLDPEFTAPITFPMALNAFRVFLRGGRSCGVQIYAEFDVISESPGFLDGGSLVLDALSPYSPHSQEEAEFRDDDDDDGILPSFVRSSSAGSEANGFVDGGALVLDALPSQETIRHVQRPLNLVGGFMDGGVVVMDSLQPHQQEYASVDETIANDANRGMTAAEISQLKVTQSGRGGTCSICLDDFSAGDLITLLPPCSHSFHAKCIAIWLRRNRTCPVCRRICTTH